MIFRFGNDTLQPGDSEYQLFFVCQVWFLSYSRFWPLPCEARCFGDIGPWKRDSVGNMVGGQPGGWLSYPTAHIPFEDVGTKSGLALAVVPKRARLIQPRSSTGIRIADAVALGFVENLCG